MKKIFLFLTVFIITIPLFSQNANTKMLELINSIDGIWKIDNNNNIYVQDVLECEGKDKEQVYFLIRSYFITTYNDANRVVQLEDKENGILIGKGCYSNIQCDEMLFGLSAKQTFWHIVKCEIRDNRVRVTITLTHYDVTYPASHSTDMLLAGIQAGTFSMTNLYPINTSKGKKNTTRDGFLFYKAITNSLGTINEIKKNLQDNNINNDTNEDW